MNVIIIPARGGSKRIPRKNIRSFRGQPMISWSINSALSSKSADLVLVSTDDPEIADLAIQLGAEAPFIRPAELSTDLAMPQAVIKHSISWLESQGNILHSVCLLFATAPFVTPSDLSQGRFMLENTSDQPFVFTATTFPYPIQRALTIDASGRVNMINPELFNSRSQDLPETFHDAGQFYWATSHLWMTSSNLYKNALPLLLPRWRVQDIDTEEDWKRAELIHLALNL